jgi:hypothetical protein
VELGTIKFDRLCGFVWEKLVKKVEGDFAANGDS